MGGENIKQHLAFQFAGWLHRNSTALNMPRVSPPFAFSSNAKNTAHSGTKLNRTIRLLIARSFFYDRRCSFVIKRDLLTRSTHSGFFDMLPVRLVQMSLGVISFVRPI